MNALPRKRRLARFLLLGVLALAAAGTYRHYTDPGRLKGMVLDRLERWWKGSLRAGDVRFTPWGGLSIRSLDFSCPGRGELTVDQVRIRFSPARLLIGENPVSDLEIDGVVLSLPSGEAGSLSLAGLPLARNPALKEERQGAMLVTLRDARVTMDGKEEMVFPLVAARCRYRSAGGSTDVTGELAGRDWSTGSFRIAMGNSLCRWGASLHDLEIGGTVRAGLWPKARAIFDEFKPGGRADLEMNGTLDPGASPVATCTVEVSVRDAELTYREFPLPFRGVRGRMLFDESGRTDLLDFSGNGAGGTVTCEGTILNKSPKPYTDLEFTIRDLPLAPVVLGAMPASLRSGWEWAGAEGTVSGRLRILSCPFLPEPLCFQSFWFTDNLALRRLPLEPIVRSGSAWVSGRLGPGRPMDVTGSLNVARGEISGREITGVLGELAWSGSRLTFELKEAQYAGGTATGRLLREWKDGVLSSAATVDLANAQIARMKEGTAFSEQAVRGSLSAHADLAWQGNDAATLKGKGEASVEDGYLFSLPPLNPLLQLLSAPLRQAEPVIRGGRLAYRLEADTLHLDLLELPSEQVTMRAHGTLRRDGAIDLRVVGTTSGKIFRRIPVVKETTEGLKRFFGWVQDRGLFVYRVTGTVREPRMEKVRLFGLANQEIDLEEMKRYRELMNAETRDP